MRLLARGAAGERGGREVAYQGVEWRLFPQGIEQRIEELLVLGSGVFAIMARLILFRGHLCCVALPSEREHAQFVDALREVLLGRSIFPSLPGGVLEPEHSQPLRERVVLPPQIGTLATL